MHGTGTALRGLLWAIVLPGIPAAILTMRLRPHWDDATAAVSLPVLLGAALLLLYTGTRHRAPRAVHARPATLTLRQLLWTGFFVSPLMIAIAQSDPVRLRVVDYCGTVLLLACPAALILRWLFARQAQRIPRSIEQELREIGQRQAWTDREVRAFRRRITAAFSYAGWDPPVRTENGTRIRHLRPVRPAPSDDTGPQQAVLCAALLAPLITFADCAHRPAKIEQCTPLLRVHPSEVVPKLLKFWVVKHWLGSKLLLQDDLPQHGGSVGPADLVQAFGADVDHVRHVRDVGVGAADRVVLAAAPLVPVLDL